MSGPPLADRFLFGGASRPNKELKTENYEL